MELGLVILRRVEEIVRQQLAARTQPSDVAVGHDRHNAFALVSVANAEMPEAAL
jgi:hypothetical protein